MTDQGRPLRILHVLVSVGPTNGQYNEHCLPLRHERRITICSLRPASITPPPEIELLEGDGSARGSLRVIRAALARGPFDVVHAHAAATGMGLLAAAFPRRPRSNHVFSMQNQFENYRFRNKLFLYPIFAAFPNLVVCGQAVGDDLPRLLRALGRQKITVVPNAVDTDRVDRVLADEQSRPADAPFTVVSVGQLIERKDPLTILLAFSSADPDGRLVFVGEGDLHARLLAEAGRIGAGARVTLTGLVGRDDVYRHVAAGDVVVSISGGEGLPVAVLEAMACGRPVILSDIPPHREIASEVDFVPLVRAGDREALARELVRFREMPADARREIGERCRALVLDRFGLAGMHRSLDGVYARAVAGGLGPTTRYEPV